MDIKLKTGLRDALMIIVGACIMAFAIKNFYNAAELVTGGVTGISIILKNKFGIELYVTNTALNIPLFLLSFRLKGWEFIKRSLLATVTLSAALALIPEAGLIDDDLLLTALFGGLLSGVGIGLVFMGKATTGGSDMLASIIRMKLKLYSVSEIMRVLDAAVVLIGAGVFGVRHAMYALIAVYVATKLSDSMIEGLKFSKAVFIISDRSEEIATVLMTKLLRGVTGLEARGMYTGSDRHMLFCVVGKKEIVSLKEIAEGIDPHAFVIVTDAREVLGEGFIEGLE